MTATRRLAVLLAVAIAGLTLAACGDGAEPQRAAYTFHRDDSGIRVDTPALRALKSSTRLAPCPATDPADAGVEGGLPDLTLPCLGGGRDVDLAGLRGPMLVNFWAQSCGPCQDESPLLEQLSRSAGGQVGVVGVDFIDPMPGLAIGFAKELGLSYPQIADPAGAAKAPLRIAALPYTFFVDTSGRIAYTQIGPIESSAELAALVREHLGVRLGDLGGSS